MELTTQNFEVVQQISNANPVMLYLASLTETGRRSQTSALIRVASMLGKQPAEVHWAGLRYEHVAALKARMRQEALKPATINRILSAIRGVAREAWRLQQMDTDSYTRLCDVGNEKNGVLPSGRALERSEVRKVMSAAQESPRDAAILAAAICGLRRSEIAGLRRGDVTKTGFRVDGKGGKERTVPFIAGAQVALVAWLEQHVDASPEAPLFYRIDRHGKHRPAAAITTDGIYKLLRVLAQEAGVDNFSPHDLRRTFVTSALEAGIGVEIVAHIAGHASVDTTRRYDRSKDMRAAAAAAKLNLL